MAGDELRIGGGVALAVGLRADEERRGAVLVEGDVAASLPGKAQAST